MQPYLIQRAKFNIQEDKKGIDSVISLDYMGSSEFEWGGALPKSLLGIRGEIKKYIYLDVAIKGKMITVFFNGNLKNEIEQYLIELSENKHHLKEFSAFDKYINEDGYFKDKFDFWWDIENNVMFWKKNLEFEEKFKLVIVKKPE